MNQVTARTTAAPRPLSDEDDNRRRSRSWKELSYQLLFRDFPVHVLHRHISASRDLPVCVILRNEEYGSKLEKIVHGLWKDRNLFHNASSWEVGSFTFNKESNGVVQPPENFPSLRCYLGETIIYDYNGKSSKLQVSQWFRKLFSRNHEHQISVTEATVDMAIQTHVFTILAFPNLHVHKDLEDVVHQLSYESDDQIKSLVIHPHDERIRSLQQRFGVISLPAAVVIHNIGDDIEPVVKLFPEVSMKRENIETYIKARAVPTKHFTVETFPDLVLNTSVDNYAPYYIGFYAFWTPQVLTFLRFFKLTILEFQDYDVCLRFGLVDLSAENKLVNRYIDTSKIHSFPFIILFTKDSAKDKLEQTPLLVINQSPYSVYLKFSEMGIPMRTHSDEQFLYQPYSQMDPYQVSLLTEGPDGWVCSLHYNNLTDSSTRSISPVATVKEKKPEKKKSWYNRHILDEIDARLPKVDGIPMVSQHMWSKVIETSHAPNHPFSTEGRWAGEYTKVAMVVFLIDGCGSCRRNWNVFKELYQAVKYIDGGSVYIANCTQDRQLCVDHHVTGFPTILAFRGFGWLGNNQCLSPEMDHAMVRSIRMDYHGVMLVKNIMEWFSMTSHPAVTNIKFGQTSPVSKMVEDVRLVATLMPRLSLYLPRSRQTSTDHVYSYQCYRLACELLYGQARCYTVYNRQVPPAEFEDGENMQVVVIKVRLERNDGVGVDIVQVGRYLRQTISEEEGPHLHTFHKPHRYSLGSTQTCEDDHGKCTDLIVSFTRDHARLPVTHLDAMAFHTKNNPLYEDNLPVLLSLVHQHNITNRAPFMKVLMEVGTQLYKKLAVVTVDVDQYPDWVSKFVPMGYMSRASVDSEVPRLFRYPRICIVLPADHHYAAFYPHIDMDDQSNDRSDDHSDDGHFTYTTAGVLNFATDFLADPKSLLIPTEHF